MIFNWYIRLKYIFKARFTCTASILNMALSRGNFTRALDFCRVNENVPGTRSQNVGVAIPCELGSLVWSAVPIFIFKLSEINLVP
jgi:hypothetical protein